MAINWQGLVEQALKLPTYSTEDDIKAMLRYRFGSGPTVRERRVSKWFEYLVFRDDLKQRDELIDVWSGLWHMSIGRGISVEAIAFNEDLDVIRKRIAELRDKLNIPF